MSQMADDRIDALVRRLDVASEPDSGFAQGLFVTLQPKAQAARAADRRRIGRLWRDLQSSLATSAWPLPVRAVGRAGLLAVIILAAMLALLAVGALDRLGPGNGLIVVSVAGALEVVDPQNGSTRALLPAQETAHTVSRSPDGLWVTFWETPDSESHLYVIGSDGRDRRELGTGLTLASADNIDTWSPDSRFLAINVISGALDRVVVADTTTGTTRTLTPPGLAAQNPIWSPDGAWIAFVTEVDSIRTLTLIRADGTGMRTIAPDVVNIAGPDTWSPDGNWIYFDGGGQIRRASVTGSASQLLSGPTLDAAAPASSPDGSRLAFMVPRADSGWDLYLANSDGTNAHRVLEHASNDGWSSDGRYVLGEWKASGQPGGLVLVPADGGDVRTVLPWDATCSGRGLRTCLQGVSWGQPRP
jgi:Tol biopolymer transport system component